VKGKFTMSTSVPETGRGRPAITLIAVCLAVLTLPASLTGVSVALPQISAELHTNHAPLQWVINSYNLAFACFMLACGSLADIFGRRRVFGIGTALFGLSTLVSAVTSDIIVLDVARALTGLGAAAVMTAGCAILATTFQGAALIRAFAMLGSAAGAGLALGPSTAGLLVDAFGWRAVFVSHLVIAVIVLAAVPMMRESKNPESRRVDWAGTATFTLSLFALMLGIVLGPQWGWGDGSVVLFFVGAVALMALFVVAELRQRQPMFTMSVFRQPRFIAVSLIPVALSFGFVCMLVLLPAYFTGAGGMSSNGAGATMMLLTLPVLVVPLVVSKLVKHGLSTRVVLSSSLLVAAAGAGWLTVIDAGISVAALVGPLLLIGVSMGMTAGLVDGLAITSVRPEQAGAAAGMFNTMRLASEAVAIAVMGAVLLNLTSARISDSIPGIDAGAVANQVVSGNFTGAPGPLSLLTDSYTGALHTVLWVVAGICAITAVVVHLMLRERKVTATPADPVESAELATASGARA
jgi:MFS family permease